MKTRDKKLYFVVISSLFYLFLFLAAIAYQRIDASLISFPLFVFGLINSSGLAFDGFIIGAGTGVPSSRNPKHKPEFRQLSGFIGWVAFFCSFILLLVAINAYNK